jgi:NAD(P)-dependent dehydrogenase (short-subunit alcohol dehydrogenase family)
MKALITGVSGNVGSACRELLEDQEWNTYGVARTAVVDNYRDTRADLSSWDGIQKVVESVGGQKFDLVVMAHGVQQPLELKDVGFADYHYVVGGNLYGATLLTAQLLARGMVNDGALFVYMSSIQAMWPRKGRGLYGIAKAGLEALARTVTVEGEGKVRGVALRLGQLTESMRGIRFSEEQVKELKKRSYGEWVSPDEVARMVLGLYKCPGVSGSVIDMASGHGLNIW